MVCFLGIIESEVQLNICSRCKNQIFSGQKQLWGDIGLKHQQILIKWSLLDLYQYCSNLFDLLKNKATRERVSFSFTNTIGSALKNLHIKN